MKYLFRYLNIIHQPPVKHVYCLPLPHHLSAVSVGSGRLGQHPLLQLDASMLTERESEKGNGNLLV